VSETTTISWTDATWNPWRGCQKVSPGCANCYMFRDQERYGRDPSVVVRAAPATFRAPLKWKAPRFVFTCSWSDWFHEDADAWRPEAWEIIRQTPQHTYQILTKRPERIAGHFPRDMENFQHVWWGVSIENQRWVRRLDHRHFPTYLSALFVSAEPLLGRVNLQDHLSRISWVIVGGESGPDHREMNLDWLRAIVEQCKAAEVPVWVKQDSGRLPGQRGRIPADLWIQERPARG
jgi:protein gp37